MDFQGQSIPFSQWDKRTPGKFKPEFVGDGMACANSKVYTIWNASEHKTSAKGTQKKRNTLVKDHFLHLLQTKQPQNVTNAGFIREGPVTKTYIQEKKGLNYFYPKRNKDMFLGGSTIHI